MTSTSFNPTNNCSQDAGGTITYTASGTAAGPYSGTFTETGTLTFAPSTAPGLVTPTGFKASFTIDSTAPAATVTGSKALTSPPPETWFCSASDFPTGGVSVIFTYTNVDYAATITTQNGSFTDSGTSDPVVTEAAPSGPVFTSGSLSETFQSSQSQATPSEPTSKADCKDGGYQKYGFKNQGQCVKYVEHSGS